jgi:hypothetical protein
MEEEIDVNSQEVKKWAIFAGLGGGFGGSSFECFETCAYEEAQSIAYEKACDSYESYVGMYGLRELSTIMEEDGVDEEEAGEIYNEEREGWLDYHVEEYDVKKHSQYEK